MRLPRAMLGMAMPDQRSTRIMIDRRRLLGLGTAAILALSASQSPTVSTTGQSTARRAFLRVLEFEDQVNARQANGTYVSQVEGQASFAQRIEPMIPASYVGVTGLGELTDYLGYQPTIKGAYEDAGAIIQFRTLLSSLDLAAGGDGTADWIHTFISGDADGNVAHMVLDFEVLGSLLDPEGQRLPVSIPFSIFQPNDPRVVPAAGRCICTCKRVGGQWKITAFYFVASPTAMLHSS